MNDNSAYLWVLSAFLSNASSINAVLRVIFSADFELACCVSVSQIFGKLLAFSCYRKVLYFPLVP